MSRIKQQSAQDILQVIGTQQSLQQFLGLLLLRRPCRRVRRQGLQHARQHPSLRQHRPEESGPLALRHQNGRKGFDIQIAGDILAIFDIEPDKTHLRKLGRQRLEGLPVLLAGSAPVGAEADHQPLLRLCNILFHFTNSGPAFAHALALIRQW